MLVLHLYFYLITGLLESPRLTHADSIIISKLQDIVRKQLGVHFDVDNEEFS